MHHKLELKQGRGNNLAGLNSLFASKTKIIIFRVGGGGVPPSSSSLKAPPPFTLKKITKNFEFSP